MEQHWTTTGPSDPAMGVWLSGSNTGQLPDRDRTTMLSPGYSSPPGRYDLPGGHDTFRADSRVEYLEALRDMRALRVCAAMLAVLQVILAVTVGALAGFRSILLLLVALAMTLMVVVIRPSSDPRMLWRHRLAVTLLMCAGMATCGTILVAAIVLA